MRPSSHAWLAALVCLPARTSKLSTKRSPRRHLERELGLSIDLFAYPFGAADNICPRNLEIVREVGYRCCVSCYGGLARNGDDVYALRRVPMSSWYENPDQLALALGLDRA